jgi:hypothetical protein
MVLAIPLLGPDFPGRMASQLFLAAMWQDGFYYLCFTNEEAEPQREARCHSETRVLNPRAKLLGFHMSGVASHPSTPNKETW